MQILGAYGWGASCPEDAAGSHAPPAGDSGVGDVGTGGHNVGDSGSATSGSGSANVSDKGHGGDGSSETDGVSTSVPNLGSSDPNLIASTPRSDATAISGHPERTTVVEPWPISGPKQHLGPQFGVPAAPTTKIPPKKAVIAPSTIGPHTVLLEGGSKRISRGRPVGARAKMFLCSCPPQIRMISCSHTRGFIEISPLLLRQRLPPSLQFVEVVRRLQLLHLEGAAREEACHGRGVEDLSDLRKLKKQGIYPSVRSA